MSSPTVIIGSPTTRLIARASNREAMDSYLAKAKQTYESIIRVNAETVAAGGRPLLIDVVAYADAESRANSIFGPDTDGFAAMKYAHAYWLSLKHPWYDQVIKCFSENQAERQEELQREAARMGQVADEILSRIKSTAKADQVVSTLQTAKPQFTWDVALDTSVRKILEHTPSERKQEVTDAILQIAASPPQERLMALEAYRIGIEQQDKDRFEREVLRLYHSKRTEVTRQHVEVEVARCEAILEEFESPVTGRLVEELASVRENISSGDVLKLESRLEELDEAIRKQKETQGLLDATIQALRRQGYEPVVMETVGPQDVRSVFLMDPNDEQRFTLLEVDEVNYVVAAAVVARQQTQSNSHERNLDMAAQKRLCKAMDAAQAALSKRFECELVDRVEAGQKIEVDKRLEKAKIKQRTNRAQTRQQQRSAS